MLFWRGYVNEDSARVDAEYLTEAYKEYPFIYYHPLPPELVMKNRTCEELTIPRGQARINFLSFTGFTPFKIPISTSEITYRLILHKPEGPGGSRYETHLAEWNWNQTSDPFISLAFRTSPVDRIEAVFDNGRKVNLSLLEDMGSVSQKLYETRKDNSFLEDLYKLGTYSTALYSGLIIHQFSQNLSKIKLNDEKIDNYFNRKKQGLDIRMSRYLPGKAYTGGINLTPGTYSLTVNYYSGNKLVETRRFNEVKAEEGKLNLIYDICMEHEVVTPPLKLTDNLPDFPGRLPAPKNVRKILDSGQDTYRLSVRTMGWDPVPGASDYYVYCKYYGDGEYYLRYVNNGKRTRGSVFDTKHTTSIRVLPLGPGGFGVPSESADQ